MIFSTQQSFSQVVVHLLTQGRRACMSFSTSCAYRADNGDKYTSCAYRADNGDKCAIGCLIDEKYYSSTFEGSNIDNDNVESAVRFSGHTEISKDLLNALQIVHDTVNPEDWQDALEDLADNYSLRMPLFVSASETDTEAAVL